MSSGSASFGILWSARRTGKVRSFFVGVMRTFTSGPTPAVNFVSPMSWTAVSCQNWSWSMPCSGFFGSVTGAFRSATAFGPHDGCLIVLTAPWRSFTRLIDFAFDGWNFAKQSQSASMSC